MRIQHKLLIVCWLLALFSGPMMRSIEKHDDDLLLRLKRHVEA